MIYRPPETTEQPEVSILQWSVKELSNGDRHLIGVVPISGHDGRVTSKIMDYTDRTITTRSGRRYHLDGPPGDHPNARYIWSAWCHYNSIEPLDAVNVTEEYVVSIN